MEPRCVANGSSAGPREAAGHHVVSAQFKLSSVAVGARGKERSVMAKPSNGEGSADARQSIAQIEGEKRGEAISDCFATTAPPTTPSVASRR